MGKVVMILGGCLVVAGGVAYALFISRGGSECAVNLHECPVAEMKCCATPTATTTSDEASPALAAVGPVALFATSSVKAEAEPACPYCKPKAKAAFTCCEDAPSTGGLEAVTGSPAALARK